MKEWEYWYKLAEDYYKEYGNLDLGVKETYKDENLGQWISDQRKKYKNTYIRHGKNKNTGKLTDNQTKLLEDIGMIWDKLEYEWNKYYSKCIEYKQINGNLIMPINTEFNDMKLRSWIGAQRSKFKQKKLRQDRINKLNELGIIWDEHEAEWLDKYEAAKLYYNKHKTLQIRQDYSIDGFNLGTWISTQRKLFKKGKLKAERKCKLDQIGMIWEDNSNAKTSFNEQAIYYYVRKYFNDCINRYREKGFEIDVYIPSLKLGIEYDGYPWHNDTEKDISKNNSCSNNGITLIRIREEKCPELDKIQNVYKLEGTRPEKNIVDAVKFIYEYINENFEDMNLEITVNLDEDKQKIYEQYMNDATDNKWEEYFKLAKQYFIENKNLNISKEYEVDGVKLGMWISRQRRVKNGKVSGILTRYQIEKLDEIGMIWDTSILNEEKWNKYLQLCEIHFEKYGTLQNIKKNKLINGKNLNEWLIRLRSIYNGNARGALTIERIEKLEAIGMIWNINEYEWNTNYQVALDYYNNNKNLRVTKKCKLKGTCNLHYWILHQRQLYKQGKLSDLRIEKLNKIGMIWDGKAEIDERWYTMYKIAIKYKDEFGHLNIKVDEKYMDENLGKWIHRQRQAYRGNGRVRITQEKIDKLEKIGIKWFPQK